MKNKYNLFICLPNPYIQSHFLVTRNISIISNPPTNLLIIYTITSSSRKMYQEISKQSWKSSFYGTSSCWINYFLAIYIAFTSRMMFLLNRSEPNQPRTKSWLILGLEFITTMIFIGKVVKCCCYERWRLLPGINLFWW